MKTRSEVSGGSEALKKAIRAAAIYPSKHQNFSKFSACEAQGNQHAIRIAFFKRDDNTWGASVTKVLTFFG